MNGAGYEGEKHDFPMAKNFYENIFGFYRYKIGGEGKQINSQP